jgi:DNA-binding SARP family transcriptional activator
VEILVAEGRSEEALLELEAWQASHPLDAEVALRLAWLLDAANGDAESARAAVRRAMRLGAGPEAIALAEQLDVEAATE